MTVVWTSTDLTLSARVSPRRVFRRTLEVGGVKYQEPAGWRRRATSRTSQTSVATGTQKISKTGGSLKQAEAVRPELMRRVSRQAAAERGRSYFDDFWIHRGGVAFLRLAGDPSQFFSGAKCGAVHRRGAGGAMTTDVRWGGSTTRFSTGNTRHAQWGRNYQAARAWL